MNKKNVPKISAFIITKDEERNIRRSLNSIKWADEIVVVDGCSKDRTVEIAKEYDAKVIISRVYNGHAEEKNKAIRACKFEWILELDADEELSASGEVEIRKAINTDKYTGYYFTRPQMFLGEKIFEDDKLRLYKNKPSEIFYEHYTHETLHIKGKVGKLKSIINHYNHQTMDETLEYNSILTTRQVEKIYRDGEDRSRAMVYFFIFYKPLFSFFFYYFYRGLIFKGFPGLALCAVSVLHEISVWLKYYERKFILKQDPRKYSKSIKNAK